MLLLFGIAKTSYANRGAVRTAAASLRRLKRRIFPGPTVNIEMSAALGLTVALSGTGAASHGALDPALTDAEKIDRLWHLMITVEENLTASIGAVVDAAKSDRSASKAAHTELSDRVTALRADMEIGMRRVALDGLRWAAVGALCVAAGDIIGAVCSL